MATCDDDSLHEENLDNTDNDKEVDDDVNESIFDDEEMKKIFKTSKKKVDELNWRTNMWMILWKPFVKMNIFKENSVSQIINHRKTKRCTIKPLKNLKKSMNPIFLFLSDRFGSNLKTVYRIAKRLVLYRKPPLE